MQRDGFCIFWLNTLSPPILDINQLYDLRITNLVNNTEDLGLQIYFLDTTKVRRQN